MVVFIAENILMYVDDMLIMDEALLEVLNETDLMNFERKLAVELQMTRLEHFDHVTDDELKVFLTIFVREK